MHPSPAPKDAHAALKLGRIGWWLTLPNMALLLLAVLLVSLRLADDRMVGLVVVLAFVGITVQDRLMRRAARQLHALASMTLHALEVAEAHERQVGTQADRRAACADDPAATHPIPMAGHRDAR